jgi:ferric-dicitrate binding protein FerR (iron transport regulator)
VRTLIRQALKGGGEDNITVVCFEIVQEGAEPPEVEELEKTREHVLEDDTLDESSGVRTLGDTMVVSAAEVQAAAAPRPRRRERRGVLAPLLLIVLVAVIVALAIWGVTR